MSGEPLLLLAVLAPFLGAIVAPWLGGRLGARAGWPLALAFVPALLLVGLAPDARAGVPRDVVLPWVPDLGLDLAFRADGFSILFALVVSGIGALVTLYAAGYLGANERHGRFFAYLLTFGGAMLGLVLADNLILLFAFWEMTSIASFLLIGFWDSRRASEDGALKALVITAIGGQALLAAVVLLAIGGGSWRLSALDVEALRAGPYLTPALLLAGLAAITKSAQLPFHLWLPTAMEAPTPVSAYLHSATMVKAGVFLVATLGTLFTAHALGPVLMYLGLATMAWGSWLALRQNDLKALLAYSTVSQLGLLMSLYAGGHPYAATAHLVNHAAFKATLFMVVGIVDHEAGSRDLSKLSGLARKLPITALLAIPAALSMAGLPPLGGFVSKELFYEEMLHEGVLPIAIAVGGSILTFAYAFRFLRVFFGPLRTEKEAIHEAPGSLWLPVAPLAVATILFGVYPWHGTIATWFTDLAAAALGYAPEPLYLWHGPNVALALSILTWFVGAALVVARRPLEALQRSLTPSWNANTVYYGLLGALVRGAHAATAATQGAGFAVHIRFIVGVFAVASLWSFLRLGASVDGVSGVPVAAALVAVLVLAGLAGALLARNRVTLLIFMSLVGFATTLVFVVMSAPDLALTQLLIETITVILFLSVFRYLPRMRRYERRGAVLGLDAAIATSVGLGVFATLLAVQTPIAERISSFFLETSKTLGGGYNVVNVILVDFRGYDTIGEITVLAVVVVAVVALLRLRAQPRGVEREEEA